MKLVVQLAIFICIELSRGAVDVGWVKSFAIFWDIQYITNLASILSNDKFYFFINMIFVFFLFIGWVKSFTIFWDTDSITNLVFLLSNEKFYFFNDMIFVFLSFIRRVKSFAIFWYLLLSNADVLWLMQFKLWKVPAMVC